jgi:hypothetical protein
MDDRTKQRKLERELWLLLIGAALSGSKSVLAEVQSVNLADAPDDDLTGFLAGILRGDKEQASSWLKRLGAERSEKETCVQAIVRVLRESGARRACQKAAGSINAMSLIEKPAAFIEFVEQQLTLIKERL